MFNSTVALSPRGLIMSIFTSLFAPRSFQNNLKNEVRKIKKEREGLETDIERTKKKLVVESKVNLSHFISYT